MNKKTIYLSDETLEKLRGCTNLSARLTELIEKGLEYEAMNKDKLKELNMDTVMQFLIDKYQQRKTKRGADTVHVR